MGRWNDHPLARTYVKRRLIRERRRKGSSYIIYVIFKLKSFIKRRVD